MQSIQECLIDLTKRRGMTLEAVAAQVGVSSDALRRMRRGEVESPGFLPVARLHALAGRSLDVLMGITPQVGAVAPTAQGADIRAEIIAAAAKLLIEQGGMQLSGRPVVADDAAGELTLDNPDQRAQSMDWALREDLLSESEDAAFIKDIRQAKQATRSKRSGSK